MKNLIIKVVIVATIAFSSVFSLATNSAYATAISSFVRTCEKISVNSGILSATCEKPDGTSQNTQIDLKKYFENSNGNLALISSSKEQEAISELDQHVFAYENGDDWFYFEDPIPTN